MAPLDKFTLPKKTLLVKINFGNNFYNLLKLLLTLKGKWLLSSYPDAKIEKICQLSGINFQNIQKNLAVNGKQNAGRKKIECLT